MKGSEVSSTSGVVMAVCYLKVQRFLGHAIALMMVLNYLLCMIYFMSRMPTLRSVLKHEFSPMTLSRVQRFTAASRIRSTRNWLAEPI
jgi:hypothetical protein